MAADHCLLALSEGDVEGSMRQASGFRRDVIDVVQRALDTWGGVGEYDS